MSNAFKLLKHLERQNESFSRTVDFFGLLANFHINQTVFASEATRNIFLSCLLSYRPVYTLKFTKSKLVLTQFETPFINENSQTQFTVSKDSVTNQSEIMTKLIESGLKRVKHIDAKGEFSVQGDIIDISLPKMDYIIRIEFFGDEITDITYLEHLTYQKIKSVNDFKLPAKNSGLNKVSLDLKNIEANALVAIYDPDIIEHSLTVEFLDFIGQLEEYHITALSFVSVGNYKYKIDIKRSIEFELFTSAWLDAKKESESQLITDSDNKKLPDIAVIKLEELEIGDYVVHNKHGIGRYIGNETREKAFGNNDTKEYEDYIIIQYASGSRSKDPDYLFIESNNLENLTKYVGAPNPKLSRFGGDDFAKVKTRARRHAKFIADKLIKTYVERVNGDSIAFLTDFPELEKVDFDFKYELTKDQKSALKSIFHDMSLSHPMDRLLCGDVGFGKTEVALRAAFLSVLNRRQVALLSPTTILTNQHYETFKARLNDYGVKIASLSRFTSKKERELCIQNLKSGEIDIVIGTHTLFSNDIQFKNLGLLIIDEEQRFGTEHKEKLKAKHPTVDILTLSATPIPKTLEMALTGIRDISIIQTPPANRQQVSTNVTESSNKLIKDAIGFELKRGGQVFYVHNNIATIETTCSKIQKLIPDAKIAIAHSKLSEYRIDKVINDFWHKKIDILVCTTIIETGLDISNANTLIVDKAQKFGLTQLHQLRGRIGRSETKAYAYFFYTKDMALTQKAYQRLETLQDYDDLGSGAAIALKDLELRGSGDYLGTEQSGHMQGVGYEMYIKFMSRAIENAKHNLSQH